MISGECPNPPCHNCGFPPVYSFEDLGKEGNATDAAIYLRKSRAEEFHAEDTLKRHREILTEYARKNSITILRIYEEIISGESLHMRPQMLTLLHDVEHGDYDAVLCMDIDRLGRGAMSDQGIILETLKAADTKIITPRKTYDLNNETDETFSEFETFLARQELKAIKRRMQRGIRKTIQEGGYLANAPYGYQKAVLQKKPTLAVKEEEARFVRMIFDLYVNQGMGCQHIADTISAMGAKPHRAERFGRTSVMKILHSETYTGKIVWNRKSKVKNGCKWTEIPNPKDKWTVTNGLHPAIISEALFRKAQEIAQTRSHPPAAKNVQNALAGLIFCAHCGAPMQRQLSRGTTFLICRKPGCMASAPLAAVESAVLQELKPVMEKIIFRCVPQPSGRAAAEREWSRMAARETAVLERQKSSLYDFLERGVYDIETFNRRKEALEKRADQLRKAAEALPCPAKPGPPQTMNLFALYGTLMPKQQNLLLKSIVARMVYQKEKGAPPCSFHLKITLQPFCF